MEGERERMQNTGIARIVLLINPFEFHVGWPVATGAEIRIYCEGTKRPTGSSMLVL